MTRFTKIAAVALTSLTVATAFAPSAEARWRGHHGGAIAAGVIGGALLGAMLARPAYAAPVYAESYEDCYRKHVGYNRYGRPIYRTVCY